MINDLSLTLKEGCIHGLVGLNGAGKTTLLKGIYGLLSFDKGHISWNDQTLTKKSIGYLSTENYFYSHITGKDYLKLFSKDMSRIEELNQLFGIPLNQLIDDYSTGMMKKVALMGVFLKDRPIYILDEPFNGVDLESSRVIHLIIEQLKNKGKTILITSHILESLTSLCDQIHYLENGKIKTSKVKEQFDELENEVFGEIHQRNEEHIKKLF
ncbi:ATP-binding cassette domain-containing protein [Flammeovirga sp. MY04]|uniref:ABC transporter ATP-binding protein n=1 Tax=Flammeovirga sp. MY04 TaxID=1191459 RepID=UPI0008060DB2|nr:ATP-binding cassette domain-containing protein [Flammeovirga sp. MY04]ANQ49278.1 ATP-binding cassette domain-containing protein [Flammeovirga sp. MY04]